MVRGSAEGVRRSVDRVGLRSLEGPGLMETLDAQVGVEGPRGWRGSFFDPLGAQLRSALVTDLPDRVSVRRTGFSTP